MKTQKCPICNGTGRVSRPSWITGEQVGLGSSTTEATWWSAFDPGPYLCQACKGIGLHWNEKDIKN